jgi:uroporphyrinogen-III synthase
MSAAPPESPAELPPLAGYTVAVTAERRADELVTLLERRGAAVMHAAAIHIVPLADDTELLAATRAVIADPPDVVVATTGIGFRGWVDAADGWGLADPLLAAFRRAELVARGPKARGAIRAAGLREAWSPPSDSTESSAEVLEHLLQRGVNGERVAVQLHGEPLPDFCAAVRHAGAAVVTVPVYRWRGPADTGPLDRLIDAAITRGIDAMTFTSAPAAASLLDRAAARGNLPSLETALQRNVLVMCVGPVTAGPLLDHDIPAVWPQRGRVGAMIRKLTEELPATARRIRAGRGVIEVRGHAAVVDGTLRPVPQAPMAVLRVLSRQPGRVVSRRELLDGLPGGGADEHAVEVAVARLRSALGDTRLVQTVVKRGYRLPPDPRPSADTDPAAHLDEPLTGDH